MKTTRIEIIHEYIKSFESKSLDHYDIASWFMMIQNWDEYKKLLPVGVKK